MLKIQQSLVSCLLLLVAATHNVVAEESSTPEPVIEIITPPPIVVVVVDEVTQCSRADSCTDCLELGFCDWYGSTCSHNTLQIADSKKYSVDSESEDEQVCQQADLDRQDRELCSSKTDCSSCTGTLLSGSPNSCAWYPEQGGFCQSELCGQIGCGVVVCPGEGTAITLSPLPLPP